jgi:hypothetical protein
VTPPWVCWWFRGAALYGAAALLLAAAASPTGASVDHYAFLFTALAFQAVFWLIGGDPRRFRPLMLCGVAEKLAFGVPCLAFFAAGRLDAATFAFGIIDLVLGAGFFVAWRATPPA